MSQTIQLRRGTAALWTSVNPTLNEGEIGFETDTGKFKIGDGATAWALLTYAVVAFVGDLTGTTNQITVTGGTNAVIGAGTQLSLPQNIHTAATPTFAGLTSSGKVLIGALVSAIAAKLEVINTDWSISAFFGDPVDAQSDSVYIVGNTINGLYGMDNDSVALWANYRGYHNGVTRFRDFIIGDGKQNPVVTVDGSNRSVLIGNGGNPAHILHVKDDGNCGMAVASNATDGEPYIAWYQTTTSRAYIQYNDQGVNPDYLEIQSDGHIYFNPTNYMGIGVASPDHPLHLVGAGYFTGGLYVGTNSTDNLIDDASNGAGSAVLYIGNKAIATTSDIAALAGVYVDIAGDTMTGTLNLDDDNISVIWGAGQDASIYYDGTNFIINPKLVGTGYVNIKGQTLVDDKVMFTQIDGNEYIDSLADGYLDLGATTEIRLNGPATRVMGDLYVGADAAVDPAIIMTGDTNDGQITWNEDENKFTFSDILNLTLAAYANNAAAVAGGLVAGDLYRTGGDPDLVCVVH